jgi:ribosome-binding protein aMBF1 (putative translation factor)
VEVKDQIKTRMKQLGVDVRALATKLDVTQQSVRHWMSGRSLPGRSKIPALEKALDFKLNFSDIDAPDRKTVESRLKEDEIAALLAITDMPLHVKEPFIKLALAIAKAAR